MTLCDALATRKRNKHFRQYCWVSALAAAQRRFFRFRSYDSGRKQVANTATASPVDILLTDSRPIFELLCLTPLVLFSYVPHTTEHDNGSPMELFADGRVASTIVVAAFSFHQAAARNSGIFRHTGFVYCRMGVQVLVLFKPSVESSGAETGLACIAHLWSCHAKRRLTPSAARSGWLIVQTGSRFGSDSTGLTVTSSIPE